jgi:hypothetical protein
MSTPLPGPSVTMSRTGRFGQASAAALGEASNSGSTRMAAISVKTAQLAFTGRLMVPLAPPQAGRPFMLMAAAALDKLTPGEL